MYSANDGVYLLFLAAVIAFVVLSVTLTYRRGRTLVERWADLNDLHLESVEHRTFRKGPFFFRSGRGHMVYYVTVRDGQMRQRHAWLRVGGWFLGLLSDEVTVEWED
jgi:hypothetical protein